MRILGLDWGTVRIGAAVSDPEAEFAFALDRPIETKRPLLKIKAICEELEVGKVIIGLPKSLSGEDSSSSLKVEKFCEALKKTLAIPVETVDERFSTVQAQSKLAEAGLSAKKQRPIKDNVAAQVMLQAYLDNRKK
ncbi:MAG: Holliday junction resolvase RuvX [Acidobacteriaceae bacterium]